MQRFLLFAGVAVVSSLGMMFASAANEDSPDERPGDEPIAVNVAPVAHYQVGATSRIRFDFVNNSEGAIRYLPVEQGRLYPLYFGLSKDGDFVEPRFGSGGCLVAAERFVRTLEPGHHLPHVIDISKNYGELPAGTYEVRAKVQSGIRDYGLTPLSFDRTILYLEITEPPGDEAKE